MTPDMTSLPLFDTPAKRTPAGRHDRDGAESRERGHRKHRRHCHRELIQAQHVILDRLIEAGEVWAPDFDNELPPARSGNRTYIGTALVGLRRAGLVRTIDGPVATNVGGRHSSYLHRWRFAVGHAEARRWMLDNPVPEPEPENEGCDP